MLVAACRRPDISLQQPRAAVPLVGKDPDFKGELSPAELPCFGGDVKMKRIFLAISLLLLPLAACGTSTSDRAISGGGIGAGAGALGGLLVGAPLEGALIGGALGAGTGALTKPSQVDLGKPIWK